MSPGFLKGLVACKNIIFLILKFNEFITCKIADSEDDVSLDK